MKDDTYCCRKDLIVVICAALNNLISLPSWKLKTLQSENARLLVIASYKLSTALVMSSCWQLWQLSKAVAWSDNCCKQFFKSFYQLWQLVQAVASLGSCYKLSTALASVTSCCQHWQLLQAVASFDSCYKLLSALTAAASFDSCHKLLPALTAVTSCLQLWQLSQALTALTSFP